MNTVSLHDFLERFNDFELCSVSIDFQCDYSARSHVEVNSESVFHLDTFLTELFLDLPLVVFKVCLFFNECTVKFSVLRHFDLDSNKNVFIVEG